MTIGRAHYVENVESEAISQVIGKEDRFFAPVTWLPRKIIYNKTYNMSSGTLSYTILYC